ncbi:MAG: hypothetical protein LBS01_00320 [Prevotellaceae bacterium]|jgi:hypothetical protein|nr:hypothetical protein [Prevotellaceae bacterium]
MERFNKFWLGFTIGILLPPVFIAIYLKNFYPETSDLTEIMATIFPSAILGKLLLLSVFPNLLLCFTCYKSDSFRIAAGFMTGGMPYLIASIFML